MKAPNLAKSSLPALHVTVGSHGPSARVLRFTTAFRIGRLEECEVCIKDDHVSRKHAEVSFQNGTWWFRDLQSANGSYSDGHRFDHLPLNGTTTIKLGILGPEVSFRVEQPSAQDEPPDSEAVVAHLVKHYFGESAANEPVGQHTMFVRKAFAQVQTKQKREYGYIVAALVLCVVIAGTYAIYERQQVKKQRALAEELFYSMKSLDVDIANLERAVLSSNNQQSIDVIKKYENRRKEMELNYDRFLATLHVYNPRMTEQEKLVLRIARIFGECELDMPPDFMAEVNRYIGLWRSSGRFTKAINTAKENGYTTRISKEFLAEGLPPQYFYLALQESDFDPYISGPVTRKGIAKGMWQFIPETGIKYGLHLGPLVDLRRPDPGDDRDHWEKATKAAASYIKDLYSTDAQASGLLVMACYNWGENQVLPLVRSMPANPKERNFWQLLAKHRDKIPQETYDYVFYIVSAAVIGENPRLFGFAFDNPLGDLGSERSQRVPLEDSLWGPLVAKAPWDSRLPIWVPVNETAKLTRAFVVCDGLYASDRIAVGCQPSKALR
jgi:membrane-bound lytic murein transglycosylase D